MITVVLIKTVQMVLFLIKNNKIHSYFNAQNDKIDEIISLIIVDNIIL
jgi:hypothetical protein